MTINTDTIKGLLAKIPAPVKHYAISAALAYIGYNYGPYAQKVASCIVGGN